MTLKQFNETDYHIYQNAHEKILPESWTEVMYFLEKYISFQYCCYCDCCMCFLQSLLTCLLPGFITLKQMNEAECSA